MSARSILMNFQIFLISNVPTRSGIMYVPTASFIRGQSLQGVTYIYNYLSFMYYIESMALYIIYNNENLLLSFIWYFKL